MTDIDTMLDSLIEREGGYSDDPADLGGETNYGITEEVARQSGYEGSMKSMPVEVAREIYRQKYWIDPNFDKVNTASPDIAEELLDTGVNMGPGIAGKFLQQALNALNSGGAKYPDVTVDGVVGPQTLKTLRTYLDLRNTQGEEVMLKALNCLQGARYIEISETRPQNERFVYGWLKHRIQI